MNDCISVGCGWVAFLPPGVTSGYERSSQGWGPRIARPEASEGHAQNFSQRILMRHLHHAHYKYALHIAYIIYSA